MPYYDSNPERRNLTILSIAIILFELAQGKIKSPDLKFPMVTIVFERILVLEIFVWVMLFWFALRYWQVNKGKFKQEYIKFVDTFNNYGNGYFSKKFIKKKVKLENFSDIEKTNTFTDSRLVWSNNKLSSSYKRVLKWDSKSRSISKSTASTLPLSGLLGLYIKFRYFMQFSIKTPGFTSYAVPYLLFYSCIIISLIKIIPHVLLYIGI